MSDSRLPFNEYFRDLARFVSSRATCHRRRVGAVIVRQNRILSTGYNGSPPGEPHCLGDGCEMEDGHCVRTVHAEANAIAAAARFGISLDGAEIYTTWPPCKTCAKLLKSAGIVAVHSETWNGRVLALAWVQEAPWPANPNEPFYKGVDSPPG